MSRPLLEPAADRPGAAFGAAGWAVLMASLLVRGGVLLAAGGVALQSDPDGYRALGENLLEFGVYGVQRQPTAYRPPLYPLLLTACVALPDEGASRVAIGALHVLLGAATCMLTLWLGRLWGLGRFAALAAALIACDPLLVNQSTLVMTETLAAFLACVALVALTLAAPSASAGRAALAGACLGLAALCRPTFLAWASLVAVGWFWTQSQQPRRWLTLAALLAGTAATLAPWAWRNTRQFGRPIVSTTHGGYTLLLGNNPGYYDFLQNSAAGEVWRADEFDREVRAARRAADDDETAADRREAALAWQTIRQRPAVFFQACLVRVGKFWGLLPHRIAADQGLRHDVLRYAAASWYFAEFSLAAASLWVLRSRLLQSPWLWGALLAGALTSVHALYWSDMRMRAPLMPVIALLAACGAGAICDWLSRRKMPADKDLKSVGRP